jgi:hypothetical protein
MNRGFQEVNAHFKEMTTCYSTTREVVELNVLLKTFATYTPAVIPDGNTIF